MQKYEITIKDNSIPEHIVKKLKFNTIFKFKEDVKNSIHLLKILKEYLKSQAIELNTDPESIQILSIKLIQ